MEKGGYISYLQVPNCFSKGFRQMVTFEINFGTSHFGPEVLLS